MIKVYSTPACPWCHKTKEFLKANKIKFEDIDVSTNINAAREMVKKSKQMGVPVIEADKEIIIGFDEEKLKKILKIR